MIERRTAENACLFSERKFFNLTICVLFVKNQVNYDKNGLQNSHYFNLRMVKTNG